MQHRRNTDDMSKNKIIHISSLHPFVEVEALVYLHGLKWYTKEL